METVIEEECIGSQEIIESSSQISSTMNENVKMETLINLNECCVSCLSEGNAEEEMKLRVDRQMIQIYKEFVNRHVS